MALLPAGFALPPLPHLLALAVGLLVVGGLLARRRPAVHDGHVLGLAPWMVAGAAGHVLYVVDGLPPVLRPLGGTPSVYVTVAVLAGAIWLLADEAAVDAPRTLGATGLVAAAATVGAALRVGEAFEPVWPAVSLAVAAVLAGATWAGLVRARPDVAVAGYSGVIAAFGHALDGVSTAVGVGILGYGERTPLSRLVIEFGTGIAGEAGAWLFVAVKLGVVAVLAVWLSEFVRDDPADGHLLFGLVAAVGLGPGVHNLLLFTVT